MAYKVAKLFCRDRSHGKLEYQGNGNYSCPVCGLSFHDDEFDEAKSSGRRRGKKEECCVACGNPAYPKCKASCSMFDD